MTLPLMYFNIGVALFDCIAGGLAALMVQNGIHTIPDSIFDGVVDNWFGQQDAYGVPKEEIRYILLLMQLNGVDLYNGVAMHRFLQEHIIQVAIDNMEQLAEDERALIFMLAAKTLDDAITIDMLLLDIFVL